MTPDRALSLLARRAGLEVAWKDAFGERRRVGPETLRAVLGALGLAVHTPAEVAESARALAAGRSAWSRGSLVTAEMGAAIELLRGSGGRCRLTHEDGRTIDTALLDRGGGHWALPPIDDWGYWQLSIGEEEMTLAVAPPRSFGLADAGDRSRCWGLAAQVYALRGSRDCGIGTFADLGELGRAMAAQGGAMLAASPVHAMFTADPARASPYSPSNRLFLNVLHGDALQLCDQLGLGGDPAFEAQRRRVDESALIDWPAASQLTLAALQRAFVAMEERGLLAAGGHGADDFAQFRRARGRDLDDHARFEALHETAAGADWRRWDPALRDPRAVAVTGFAGAHRERVAFHAFAQWRADVALADAHQACRGAGMPIGLIADLAVGVDPAGSQPWSRPDDFLHALSIGAPPDQFNPLGQSWGLAAFSPLSLARSGYAPFIALLRALLRHAGGVRIDHILGLRRLWLVPDGAGATEGAYLRYPEIDLLRLLRLESWRHRAIVIGEDLGTVPPGFRATLAAAGVLGTRVLWFEQDSTGGFRAPGRWSPHAIAMSTTHDLPTIAGWWSGRDLHWRNELHLYPGDTDAAAAAELRAAQRPRLWQALTKARVAGGTAPGPAEGAAVVEPVCRFLARTRSPAVLLPLEDAIGADEQPNLPGTIGGHPNWRRRLPGTAGRMLDGPRIRSRLQALDRG